MTLYYSQSSGGFYDSDIHTRLPEDAVAISPEQHAALLAGQSAGQVIMPGKDGKPVLAEQPPCPSSTWDGEQWHIDPECAAQLKAEQWASGFRRTTPRGCNIWRWRWKA